MQAQGANGTVQLFENHILIRREGIRNTIYGMSGDKTIPLSSISAVKFSPAAFMSHGYIKFSLPGASERKVTRDDLYKDENVVFFKKDQQSNFEALRRAIEAAIHIPSLAAMASHYARASNGKAALNNIADNRSTGQARRFEPFEQKPAHRLAPPHDPHIHDAEWTEIGTHELPIDPAPSWKDYWLCLNGRQKILAVLIVGFLVFAVIRSLPSNSFAGYPSDANASDPSQANDNDKAPFNSLCTSNQCQWVKIVRSQVVQSGTDGYGQDSKLFKVWLDNGRSPRKSSVDASTDSKCVTAHQMAFERGRGLCAV